MFDASEPGLNRRRPGLGMTSNHCSINIINYQLDILQKKQYSVAIRGEFPDNFKIETEEKQKWQMV
jgi:hypothetical protein